MTVLNVLTEGWDWKRSADNTQYLEHGILGSHKPDWSRSERGQEAEEGWVGPHPRLFCLG